MQEIIKKTISSDSQWQIEFSSIYSAYLDKYLGKDDFDFIIKYANTSNNESDFRWHIEIGSMQFLAGVFTKDRVIKLASKNLSYEMGQLKLESENSSLKDFAQSIAKIPVENSPAEIEMISLRYDLPLFDSDEFNKIAIGENQLSQKLINCVKSYKQSLFERVSDYALDLTANYQLIRIHLLKFLAILPCLDHDKSGKEVKRIILEALRRIAQDSKKAYEKKLKGQKRALPSIYIYLINITYYVFNIVPAILLAGLIRKSTEIMARRFIAGVDINDAATSIKGLIDSSRDATIDQLGELVVSKHEADIYCNKVLEIINGIENTIEVGATNASGVNKAHVSIKVTALTHDFKPQDFDYNYKNISPRLFKILMAAKEKNVFVNVDAEHYHYRDCVFKIYKKVLLENSEMHDFTQTGIVLQAYLKDAYKHFMDILELAKQRNIPMPIRLVKGAYWDAETVEATAHNFEAPQFLNKDETDLHFRQLIYKILENHHYLKLAIASHNIKDHCFAEVIRQDYFPNAFVIEHQCLHMTYEALSVGMAKMGWPVRNYIPVGDLLVGMAYLVRRIMENSSQVGVLTIMRSHNKSLDHRSPIELIRLKLAQKQYEYESSISEIGHEFKNVYPIRSYLQDHLSLIDNELSKKISELENGKLYYDEGDQVKVMSSDPSLIIGKFSFDTKEKVDHLIENHFKYFQNKFDGYDNFERLKKIALVGQLMLTQREELTVLIMLEAGKTIDEATADVDEAIDFINFYVIEQLKLHKQDSCYPRGVVGVIAPWNFPLAIPCGMTIAALSAGNEVILKPAEQTPLIAKKFVQLCYEAGITEDELSLVIGEGDIGAAIVEHPKVNGIVFTGSKAVGEIIYSKISTQTSCDDYSFDKINKFAITEMGGKNAIIVTNNCELDETVSGIIYAAFAHAGQKCSAASRVIIDNQVKDVFIERFKAAVNDLLVGKSTQYSTLINPLITKEDQQRVKEMAKRAVNEVAKFGGRVIVDRSDDDFPGFCVGPSVFELDKSVVMNNETMATEEVFGPMVHIIGYDDLDEAIEIFNSTNYALTGGIYCQSQDDIDYLAPKLMAGNIYINRPNTGARVGIEPFGGFKMSGTGPKAGGVDYLSRFNQFKKRDLNRATPVYDFNEDSGQLVHHHSGLPLDHRVRNTSKLVNSILKQFEVIFNEITNDDKEKLAELEQAIKKDFFNLSDIEFPNQYIPGQLSFCKRDLPLGVGCLIENTEKLKVQVLIDFLINLLVGNGITILCTNKKAFDIWKRIVELAHLSGFSTYNVNIEKVTKLGLQRLLSENRFNFCILSTISQSEDILGDILKKSNEEFLVKIMYAGQNENWSQGIESFTHCRAFAINTMRHGAPMDISI